MQICTGWEIYSLQCTSRAFSQVQCYFVCLSAKQSDHELYNLHLLAAESFNRCFSASLIAKLWKIARVGLRTLGKWNEQLVRVDFLKIKRFVEFHLIELFLSAQHWNECLWISQRFIYFYILYTISFIGLNFEIL